MEYYKKNYFSIFSIILLSLSLIAFSDNLIFDVRQESNSDPKFIIHGLFMYAWFIILVIQANYIRSKNYKAHMRLGIAGMVTAIGVFMSTVFVFAAIFEGLDAMPFFAKANRIFMLSFAVLVFLGYLNRKSAARHKRFILVASLYMLEPILSRVSGHLHIGNVEAFIAIVWNALFISLFVYDWLVLKKIHKITWMGFVWFYTVWGISILNPFQSAVQKLQNDGIATGTLKEAGMDENLLAAMTDSILNGVYHNIHSVLILKDNKLVYENYFDGDDRKKGIAIKNVIHHRDSLHDVRSVSKSIVSAAVMIALDKDLIRSIDQSVFDFFPEYQQYNSGLKSKLKIRHLLTMSAGMVWDEDISYADPNNSERLLNNAEDPLDYFFSQEMVHEPGTVYNYNGGCTQVLAAIVHKASGLSIIEFTEQNLFKPLGIETFSWYTRPDGIPVAASGIRLRSRDMAKIGLLYLQGGVWSGRQIISAHAVSESMKAQIDMTLPADDFITRMEYSYQFWIPTFIVPEGESLVILALGNGGQIILINKDQNLVMVTTAGNYDERDLNKYPEDLYVDFVYPSLKVKK